MLALGLRVTIFMIGLSVSPSIGSGGLAVLCQSSQTGGTGLPSGGQHNPAHCICGTSCSHIGQTSGLVADAALSLTPPLPAGIDLSLKGAASIHVSSRKPSGPIRAPPIQLT
ncbi:hypothetical protein V6575_04850 [Roseibium sp. H3510]|uniref:Secreted protein n=2 Tax=Roseibium algae TaxID=3123038 RepID=A0ABU8TGX6_9HYPH